MRLSSFYLKYIPITSLVFFSLIEQTKLWSNTVNCSGDSTVIGSDPSNQCCTNTSAAYYSWFGQEASGSTLTRSCSGSTGYTITQIQVNPYDNTLDPASTFTLDNNGSDSSTNSYSFQWQWSNGNTGNMALDNTSGSTFTVYADLSVIAPDFTEQPFLIFTGGDTIVLANSSNNFQAGTFTSIASVVGGTTLQILDNTFAPLTGIGSIVLGGNSPNYSGNGAFSAPNGGTLNLNLGIATDAQDCFVLGGSSLDTPLILTSVTNDSGWSFLIGDGLTPSYVNIKNNSYGADFSIDIPNNAFLLVDTTEDLNTAEVNLTGGTIISMGGDFNTVVTNLIINDNSTFNMNGYPNTYAGSISGEAILYFEDTAGGGSISFDSVSEWPTGVQLNSGAMTVSGSTINMSSDFVINGGTLNISGGSPFVNAPAFLGGTVNVTEDSSINLYYSEITGSTTNVIINPSTTLTVLSQTNSSSNGSYLIGNYSGSGGLSFEIGGSNIGNLSGLITGSLEITISDGFTLNSNGFSATGSLQLIEGGTYNLSYSSDVLTLVTGSSSSSIQGSITGNGSVVIDGGVAFGGPSNLITNTFSGGLTLASSGGVEFWSTTSLSTGTITGSGGDFTSEVS
ncbi:MAG: hypothetical protein JSS09_07595, partial [Verrucomicrobia bacterium]|nr:hypothetical protein [Verrucomicrobiota bacterium]